MFFMKWAKRRGVLDKMAPPGKVSEKEGAKDKIVKEERAYNSILSGQKTREEVAMRQGRFVKNQRVRYYHKATETWEDHVHVVGVHLDDGVDHPYYTIRIRKLDGQSIEKQTTNDRLQPIEWDEKESLKILESSMTR